MLISPIGSLAIEHSKKIVLGNFGIIRFLLAAFIIIIFPIIIGFIYGKIETKYSNKLPSETMRNAIKVENITYSAIIAVLCAIAFPYATEHKKVEMLISIGMATALLPPLVNVGLHLATDPTNDNIWVPFVIFLINFVSLAGGSLFYFMYYCQIFSTNKGNLKKLLVPI